MIDWIQFGALGIVFFVVYHQKMNTDKILEQLVSVISENNIRIEKCKK